MTHALKVWKEFYKAIDNNEKLFELRKDDRAFKVGDTLLLQEYDASTSVYTGNEKYFIITYVLKGAEQFGLKNGFCILSIKEKESNY